MSILGIDIGGANIKAADQSGRAISRPFPIWKNPDQLPQELGSILSLYPDSTTIALTMTAELADCFETKAAGIRFILDAVNASIDKYTKDLATTSTRSIAPQPISAVVWTTKGRFLDIDTAKNCPAEVAAANWHALATWCGAQFAITSGLLIDIGTTTTDVIPIEDGRPVPQGFNDVDRMQSGELTYSGVRRTPLCSVALSVPFRESYCPLAAEFFATTLDIYLLLDEIEEDETDRDTANGQPALKRCSHDRIGRLVCCDRDEVSYEEAVLISRFLADVQRQRLAGSLERVTRRLTAKCDTVVISGSGTFLARRLIVDNSRISKAKVVTLADQLSQSVADAACAYAVSKLAVNAGFT